MNSFSPLASKVFKAVNAQNLVIGKKVVSLKIEEVFASNGELSLKSNQS